MYDVYNVCPVTLKESSLPSPFPVISPNGFNADIQAWAASLSGRKWYNKIEETIILIPWVHYT